MFMDTLSAFLLNTNDVSNIKSGLANVASIARAKEGFKLHKDEIPNIFVITMEY